MLSVLVKTNTYPHRQIQTHKMLEMPYCFGLCSNFHIIPLFCVRCSTALHSLIYSSWAQGLHAASMNAAQQSGRPLLCPLCCPYTLVDTAILPRQLCLLHPGPHLHPTQFFQPQLPTPSQVQKQLELVNRLSANWGWKILYQSQWSRGMEQLREEGRGRKIDLEGRRVERMTELDRFEGR